MNRVIICALGLTLGATSASAADKASGSSALALAALVGIQSPTVSAGDKKVLADMLAGNLTFSFPAGGKIAVTAHSVTCRASDVDISEHDCTFNFGATTQTIKGREAHELYATLIENGVGSDGAAGSIFEAVSHLSCTIKPAEVKQRGGGGADCS